MRLGDLHFFATLGRRWKAERQPSSWQRRSPWSGGTSAHDWRSSPIRREVCWRQGELLNRRNALAGQGSRLWVRMLECCRLITAQTGRCGAEDAPGTGRWVPLGAPLLGPETCIAQPRMKINGSLSDDALHNSMCFNSKISTEKR
ncbi:unnamed protein product [Ixodes pacificus]